MIAVATSLLQRALKLGVLPTTKNEWIGAAIGFTVGVVLDFVGWWAFWPASFDRCITVPVRRLLAVLSDVDGQGEGDSDDDPDGGGYAMWAWCPVCDTHRLDPDERCRCCDAYIEEAA